ncbi:MAG: hypothetical protein A3F95_01190 [Candidatus Nealsonbacteria bacterium RIFCSPLOWO2_12_FULL_39_31]|uniref:Uncharacterized protein n=2 Tax=Candidatus Nealsoniibacteriota TaxID=1817911 RepID=A0A1G2EJW0_9BACT|nr:MAG: hypothetical protein US88_C0008G0033 [Parcubacteria group bacterium GW2011_GWA2_38_27]KKQ96835.1 MAG: hypothetical protein UT22_C0023G0005 [Parcubacteria group bacterium GW2011_GWC2_39_11]OGZ19328.1 MAG: hypothetical protein A2626_00965 [Candidatus Nealsonbacteria bacterium RIFCSPHIGHO2_01_FULL_38_55]OGZ22126.1 MAG: hypothetical protein A2W55_00280 [Candidatus Nealsonbacteria bacterium RIFCSPHIGHO2_02_38_10]OGZ22234.1 MAG: hypothetical protein A3C48_01595 [Candidatus Nealsonbacteria bac
MTQIAIKKFNRDILGLKKEVRMLRSFLIGNLLKDNEGEYKQKFIRTILMASKENAKFVFKNGEIFLGQLQKKNL